MAEYEPLERHAEIREALDAMTREYEADPWGLHSRRIYARLWLEWAIGVSVSRGRDRDRCALSARIARQRYYERVAEDAAPEPAPAPSPRAPRDEDGGTKP